MTFGLSFEWCIASIVPNRDGISASRQSKLAGGILLTGALVRPVGERVAPLPLGEVASRDRARVL
jgi:hypothetical protein